MVRFFGDSGVLSSVVVSRRVLAGLVALGGAGVVASCRGGGGGACPRSGRDPGVETRVLKDRGDVDGRLWEAATAASWRTDTGLRFTDSLSGRYLDYDDRLDYGGPDRVGVSRPRFVGMPRFVHEDGDCVVVQAGSGVCALERADGRVRWSVVLDAPSQGLVAGGVPRELVAGGVSCGLVWTNAGAVDLGTGEVRGVPEAVSRAVNLVAGEGVVVTIVPTDDGMDELVCLESHGCSERWRNTIKHVPYAPLELNGGTVDNSVSFGSGYYDLDSGEHHLMPVSLLPPRMRDGVFIVVDTEVGRRVRVVVDDDGEGVAVRAFAPSEGENVRDLLDRSRYREWSTSGEELWSVPLEARPGAVVAIDSALGERGSSFWVMELDDSDALYLSYWQPGPA